MRRPSSRASRRRHGRGAADRISGLPTDLLLRILGGVRSAHTVARAGGLSRSWRGLWALLPEIHLHGVKPGSFSAALARLKATAPAPPHLIDIISYCHRGVSSHLVTSWLRRVAGLAPRQLSLTVTSSHANFTRSVRLPCLHSTKSIVLKLRYFRLTPPLTGDFLELERLVVKECRFDAAALLPRCPCLRELEVAPEAELDSPVTVESPLLEELVVVETLHRARFNIVAPMLKHMSLSAHIRDASVSAPNLEKLTLDCWRDLHEIQLGTMQQLKELTLFGLFLLNGSTDRLGIGHGVEMLLLQLPHLHLLRINIALSQIEATTIYAWLKKLPKTNTLMLQLFTYGRQFDATLLQLLKMIEGVEELIMHIDSPKETIYHLYCYPQASTSLLLPVLKKVEFKGFTGEKSAVNVLKLLFTSAKALEQMTVTLGNNDQTDKEIHKQQLFDIFTLYPSVKCKVLDV